MSVTHNLGKTIQSERKRQKLSLDELARRSDVSKGMLSHVETGKATPSITILNKIAVGLQVDIRQLLPRRAHAQRVWRIVRFDDENYVFAEDEHHRIRALSPLALEKNIEFYELILKPKGTLVSDPHSPGAEEILTVASGHVRVKSGDHESDLRRGDSAYYAADVPHTITNLTSKEAVAYLILRWQ
jgi:transcriptional regulator with XRE-family HTH domain